MCFLYSTRIRFEYPPALYNVDIRLRAIPFKGNLILRSITSLIISGSVIQFSIRVRQQIDRFSHLELLIANKLDHLLNVQQKNHVFPVIDCANSFNAERFTEID